jgi:hypothetical protein
MNKLIKQLVIRSSSTRVRNKIKRVKLEQNISFDDKFEFDSCLK